MKILIPGVGNAQVDFIKVCKSFGYEVFTCSYKDEGKGRYFSDQFNVINIVDADTIEAFMRDNEISQVYTVGSDLAMPTVSKVAKALEIPHFISEDTARICNTKNLLRAELENLNDGHYSIAYKTLLNFEDFRGWNHFPAIVKPVDGQGQRGITIVNSAKDLKDAFEWAIKHSIKKQVIVEEYIEGFEISVNGYIVNSDLKFNFVSERISFSEYPGGIIKSHLFPVSKSYNNKALHQLLNDVCTHLVIQNGPVYFQIKIDHLGFPKLIEVTPRLDGCHLWNLIFRIGGPNLLEITLKHLEGCIPSTKDLEFNLNSVRNASLDFFTQNPNSNMDKSNFITNRYATYVEWYYDNDEKIKPINNFQEKVGYQIIIQ